MKVLIFEDEQLAQERITKLLAEYSPDIEIIGIVESVSSGIEWFKANQNPDFILMDVQLDDGISFEVFEYIDITAPVIFTTAYDEYAIKAFKVNSVDYLLKPISFEELKTAIDKLKSIYFDNKKTDLHLTYKQISDLIGKEAGRFKERFLIKVRQRYKSILTQDIAYFFIEENAVFAHTESGKEYGIDFTLNQLEEKLDPKLFFRINRKYIVNINYISDIFSYSSNRLKLNLTTETKEDMIISRDKNMKFKKWID